MDRLIKQLEEYIPYNEQEATDLSVMLNFAKNNPDALYRENRVAHFAVSAWVVNPRRTKVLMIYHNIYNSWSWVGGHADGDSDLLSVAVKETAEETGLEKLRRISNGIFSVNTLAVERHIKKGRFVNSHLHLDVEYLFEADDSLPLRIREDENSAVGWIEIDRLDDFVTEEKMKPVYRHLCEKMKNY